MAGCPRSHTVPELATGAAPSPAPSLPSQPCSRPLTPGDADDPWAAMMDLEASSLRERVGWLEARCRVQGEEVAGLRAGMADCLRRIAMLEGDRRAGQVSRSFTPLSSLLQPATMNGLGGQMGGSRIPRRPASAVAGGRRGTTPPPHRGKG